ncbi:uncharacterized protein EI97DRAFT_316355 [Westerdykella ornata]|uniref:Rhodopsin domain-containing protein n=1 Tax=Westerdykella ornata TaxID=318751 RepID=A0A6A6JJ41_WESOR|nr:uncharacterized protein EI97DRAFT_316355 [Westerdykella ornata]KAF2276650.1 hypothetical protein EI97DRAFT_316355 [Westerdykella ornata]
MAPATPPPPQMPDYRVTPLLPSPTGHSNFVNPETRSPMALAVCGVMLGFMVTALLLRFYARHRVLGIVGVDDWVALLAAVFVAEYTVYAMVLFTMPGMGPHIWDIPGIVFLDPKFGLRLLFTEIMYAPSAYLTKLSILLLYRRIFVAPGGKAKYFINAGIVLATIAYLALFILSFAFCTKSQSLVDGGECHSKGAQVGWALAATNLAADLYLLAIPPFIIAHLHLSVTRKWQIASIFLLGIGGTVSSVVCLYLRVHVAANSTDFSWNIIPPAIASVVELNVGIIVASLPALNVLLHRGRNAGTGRGSHPSRGGWSLQHLVSRISNRARGKDLSYGDASVASHSQSQPGDRDIVKLLEINQYSTNTHTGSVKSGSPAASAHRHSSISN